MKKYFSILMVALAAIVMVSCEPKNEPKAPAHKTYDINIEDGVFFDDYAAYGIGIALGEDETYHVEFYYMLSGEDLSASADDFFAAYVSVADTLESEAFELIDFSVVPAKGDAYKVAAVLVDSASLDTFKVAMGFEYAAPNPYDYDEAANVTNTYNATNAQCAVINYTAQYGDVMLAVQGQDNSMLELDIITSTFDATTGVPAGTYPINATENQNTVFASPGSDGQYIYPSFYGFTDAEGYIEKIWFLVSGTVTINASAAGVQIIVDAKNSLGNSVKVAYEGPVKEMAANVAPRKAAKKPLQLKKHIAL